MEKTGNINSMNDLIPAISIRFDKRLMITVLISTVLFGLFGHGMMLLNFYYAHDGCGQFDLGTTCALGRWVLDVFEKLHRVVWGMYTYETNWFQGLISLLFIGLTNYLIIDFLEISGKIRQILLCGILAVFPSITGLFAYMFTAPYYLFSMLLAVSAAVLACRTAERICGRKEKLLRFVAAAVILCISIGIYQAYLSHFAVVVVLFLIKKEINGEYEENKKRFHDILFLLLVAAAGLVIYLVTNRIYLACADAGMWRYQGLDHFGISDVQGYLNRISRAYYRFFIPDPDFGKNMFPFRMYTVYRLLLIPAVVLCSAVLVVRRWKQSRWAGGFLLFYILVLPVAVNFIYILTEESAVYSLTLYAQSFVFVIFILFAERVACRAPLKEWSRAGLLFVSALCLYACLFYCKLDNVEYTKLGEYIEQNKSWYTTLVTRIKSVENFSDTLPVVYINEYEKKDEDLYYDQMFSAIAISPYDDSNITVNGYWWKDQMFIYTGFHPVLESEKNFASLPEVQSMACYPDDGSIQIVNGTVVVKFS